jgi:NhaP-type Na+/H+ or K+/H+ antiporter
MYISAEGVHSSGVLAVVSGGLLLANKRHLFLSSTSRLRGVNVWESFCFVLNGLVFMLIGLALPEITEGLKAEGVNLTSAIGYGLLITGLLVIGRILSAYGAVVVTLIMRNFITVADGGRNPGFRVPLVLGWSGMRGVVSLAAALSIPVQLADGSAFPHRNLILFITFIVILLTLVIQGLSLPYLIRKLVLPNMDHELPEDEVYHNLRKQLAQHAIAHLQNTYSEQLATDPVLQQMERKWQDTSRLAEDIVMAEACKLIYLDILSRQREWLMNKNDEDATLNEDIIRKHLVNLDLEEEKLRYL